MKLASARLLTVTLGAGTYGGVVQLNSNHSADDVDALYDLAHGRHFICFSPFNSHNDYFQMVVWGGK